MARKKPEPDFSAPKPTDAPAASPTLAEVDAALGKARTELAAAEAEAGQIEKAGATDDAALDSLARSRSRAAILARRIGALEAQRPAALLAALREEEGRLHAAWMKEQARHDNLISESREKLDFLHLGEFDLRAALNKSPFIGLSLARVRAAVDEHSGAARRRMAAETGPA